MGVSNFDAVAANSLSVGGAPVGPGNVVAEITNANDVFIGNAFAFVAPFACRLVGVRFAVPDTAKTNATWSISFGIYKGAASLLDPTGANVSMTVTDPAVTMNQTQTASGFNRATPAVKTNADATLAAGEVVCVIGSYTAMTMARATLVLEFARI